MHKRGQIEGRQTTYVWHTARRWKGMRRLLPLLALAALALGCAASAGEDSGSSDEAVSLQTLTAAACKTPVLKTKAMTGADGAAIPGSASTTINGCIVGKTGESGKDVSARVVTLLGDTAHIGKVLGADGEPVFAKFTPGPPSGTLGGANGIVQDVDVTLSMFSSPSSRLRITRKLGADGVYSLHITNVTPFKASVAFIPVTAIDAGNLTLDVQMKQEANGLGVTGGGSVQLDVMQDQAAGASGLVNDLFSWLKTELAR